MACDFRGRSKCIGPLGNRGSRRARCIAHIDVDDLSGNGKPTQRPRMVMSVVLLLGSAHIVSAIEARNDGIIRPRFKHGRSNIEEHD